MSIILTQIEEHENKIKELTEKLENSLNIEEKLLFTKQINQEKDFIISLYKINSELNTNRKIENI